MFYRVFSHTIFYFLAVISKKNKAKINAHFEADLSFSFGDKKILTILF